MPKLYRNSFFIPQVLRYILSKLTRMLTMQRVGKRILIAFAGFAVWGAAIGQPCETPLPLDVVKPSTDGAGRASFLGFWGDGKWDGKLCHTLVVESLSDDGAATVVYSHGTYSGWNIRAPGFYRVKGRFEGDTLHLNFPTIGARAEYKLVEGSLHGKYFSGPAPVAIVMTRKP
jgi:hypothetical protein